MVRFEVKFETRNDTLPIDYRRKFLSYLKSAVEDYSIDLFKALYGEGHQTKSFCFSIYFIPTVLVTKDEVTLHSRRLQVTFTTQDMLMGIHLVNAFMSRLNKWVPLADCNNELKATSINKVPEAIIPSNTAAFKILSPVVIRDHNDKDGKDWYYTFEDDQFETVWKRNLKSELLNFPGKDVSNDVDALRIRPIDLKKTVVRYYGIMIPCTIGSLIIEGENYLLEHLYKAGMGSRRAMCFGCLDVI